MYDNIKFASQLEISILSNTNLLGGGGCLRMLTPNMDNKSVVDVGLIERRELFAKEISKSVVQVLGQVHPDSTINPEAVIALTNFLAKIMENIVEELSTIEVTLTVEILCETCRKNWISGLHDFCLLWIQISRFCAKPGNVLRGCSTMRTCN